MNNTSMFSTSMFTSGRITTQPLRVFALSFYISILIVEIIFRQIGWCGSDGGSVAFLGLVAILFVLIVLERAEQYYFVRKPPLHLAIASIALRTALIWAAGVVGCSGFHTFFALIPPLLAYLYIGYRSSLIVAAIHLVLYFYWLSGFEPLSVKFLEDENVLIEAFMLLIGLILVVVMGRVLTLEERNRERAEQLLVELEQSQKQLTELAKVDERNRIARDIHDSVGHHLMAITIQLEKAIAFRTINSDETEQAMLDAKRSARAALADVRESVSSLRDPDGQFELIPALNQLVDGFTHIPTMLHIDGNESLYAKSTLMALYRAAQEGLTNIEKYAGATEITVQLSLQPDYASLVVKDNGVGFDVAGLEDKERSSHAHFGLIGLRERLELVGGTLTIESKEKHGTTLHVRAPARGLGQRAIEQHAIDQQRVGLHD